MKHGTSTTSARGPNGRAAESIASRFFEELRYRVSIMTNPIRLWHAQWRLHDSFEQLGASEVARDLCDAGFARRDLAWLLKGNPEAPRLQSKMMQRLGIDIDNAWRHDPQTMRELHLRCGRCRSWRRCRWWLHRGGVGETYRLFCPNAETLDELPHKLSA